MDEARTISLNILQRTGLEELLGSRKGKREDNQEFFRVRRRIKLSLEEKKDLQERGIMIQQGNGAVAFDEERMIAEGETGFTLESSEVRKLRKMIDDLPENTPAMMEWLEPIQEQLEAKVSDKPQRPALVEASA